MVTAIRTIESVVDALDSRRPDFHILTGSLKTKEDDGDGRPHVMCTASSTAIDLEADRFTASALKQMKDGFVGKIIFLNHSYKVPHDVFGVVEATELVKREGRLDLDMDICVEMNNPLAVQTYQYIKGGTVLGVSVGVIVTEADKSEDEDDYGKTIVDINGVIPLEASIVGIPANQTAWTREAIKSLFASGRLDLDAEEIAARPWLQTAKAKEDNMATKHTDDEAATVAEAAAIAAAQAAAAEAEATAAAEAEAAEAEATAAAQAAAAEAEATAAAEAAATAAIEAEAAATAAAAEADKGEFEDDVAADEAATMLIDKMFTGLYVALDNLVDILLNTDLTSGEREKAGVEVIDSWTTFIGQTWGEIIEHLDEASKSEADEINLAAHLHDALTKVDSVLCAVAGYEALVAKVAEIGDSTKALVEERDTLSKESAQKSQAITYLEQVLDAMMELPLPTITTEKGNGRVVQSLAERFPALDTRVVERMARFAPPDPHRS